MFIKLLFGVTTIILLIRGLVRYNPKTLSENYDEVYFTNSYFNWEELELPDNVSVIKVV